MQKKTAALSDDLYVYMSEVSLRELPVQLELRKETATMAHSNMQIGADQGQFMQLLVKLIGAKRCLEIGVFTGYSSLAVALALPSDGKIIACDVSEEYTTVARKYWERAGVSKKIDLRLGPAVQTLDELLRDGQAGQFDFAFIDADKTGYDSYYERILQLLRPNGLIAIDNVFWGGAVADSTNTDPDTSALRALNAKIGKDDRVDISMLPICDGLTIARKR
ncbi:MAG: class I SAM-dependent methyltransferase [Candidatus Eremiobacteraeota bacterium]|nr:class I SAM-dependent methyltransferase [Candidatus Eremiobacteraeota bacterium]